MTETLLVIGWFACGCLAWGITVGDWLGHFPEDTARDFSGIAGLMFVMGPIGLAASICASNFCQHGVRWR